MVVGILCRICRCLAGRPRECGPSAKPAGDAVGEERAEAEGPVPGDDPEGVVDDLTAIRGIGITVQNRLNRASITTYAELAEAKPEQVREALGKLSRVAKVEAWISQARELVASK
jgi:predicted flap endonuclease-1-like 5' DNA nuclease